jgi:hypothetical protein
MLLANRELGLHINQPAMTSLSTIPELKLCQTAGAEMQPRTAALLVHISQPYPKYCDKYEELSGESARIISAFSTRWSSCK